MGRLLAALLLLACPSDQLTLKPFHTGQFTYCMGGPGVVASWALYPCSNCECEGGVCWMICWPVYDCDGDADVDLADWAVFQRHTRE